MIKNIAVTVTTFFFFFFFFFSLFEFLTIQIQFGIFLLVAFCAQKPAGKFGLY